MAYSGEITNVSISVDSANIEENENGIKSVSIQTVDFNQNIELTASIFNVSIMTTDIGDNYGGYL